MFFPMMPTLLPIQLRQIVYVPKHNDRKVEVPYDRHVQVPRERERIREVVKEVRTCVLCNPQGQGY